MALVEVRELKVHFKKEMGFIDNLLNRDPKLVYAVDGVSFDIDKQKTFSLVGESGCGKSTIARSILQLVQSTSGSIKFDDQELIGASGRELMKYRRKAQMIFQDPRSSLNPRKTAEELLEEPFKIHQELKENITSVDDEIDRLMDLVGLSPKDRIKFPHEFSGGQARRIGIARALAVNPELLVCDEPTSGLDVSIMAAVINLMMELQEKLDLTLLWISHNLHVVKHLSDYVGVMYLGKMVEKGLAKEIFKEPLHPYTNALFSSVPQIEDDGQISKKIVLKGEVPSPINPPSGCSFHPRCQYAKEICYKEEPKLKQIGDGRAIACHLHNN